jgi:thiamine-phosphate pyrophosphorylase
LPRGSGLIFRHYHLNPSQRRARFDRLVRIARRRGHLVALSASAREARVWGADAAYGPAQTLARGPQVLRLVTVHSLAELRQAARADAVIISPVFATRSHHGSVPLGIMRFRLLARRARVPVIALGGMNSRRAKSVGSIAFSPNATRWIHSDS